MNINKLIKLMIIDRSMRSAEIFVSETIIVCHSRAVPLTRAGCLEEEEELVLVQVNPPREVQCLLHCYEPSYYATR